MGGIDIHLLKKSQEAFLADFKILLIFFWECELNKITKNQNSGALELIKNDEKQNEVPVVA